MTPLSSLNPLSPRHPPPLDGWHCPFSHLCRRPVAQRVPCLPLTTLAASYRLASYRQSTLVEALGGSAWPVGADWRAWAPQGRASVPQPLHVLFLVPKTAFPSPSPDAVTQPLREGLLAQVCGLSCDTTKCFQGWGLSFVGTLFCWQAQRMTNQHHGSSLSSWSPIILQTFRFPWG